MALCTSDTARKVTQYSLSESAFMGGNPDTFVDVVDVSDVAYTTELVSRGKSPPPRVDRIRSAVKGLKKLWSRSEHLDIRRQFSWAMDLTEKYPELNHLVVGRHASYAGMCHDILSNELCCVHRNATLEHAFGEKWISPHPWDLIFPPFKEVDTGALLLSAWGVEGMLEKGVGVACPDSMRYVLSITEGRKATARTWFWCGVHALRKLDNARRDMMYHAVSALTVTAEEAFNEFHRRR